MLLLYHKFSDPFMSQMADATAGLPAWSFGKSQSHIPLISANDLIHDKTPPGELSSGCHIIELASEPRQQQAQGT